MAKIEETKDGRKDGAYTRLFDNIGLGQIFSRTHATTNRAGIELEKIINERLSPVSDQELNDLLSNNLSNINREFIVLGKKEISKLYKRNILSKQPDYIYISLVKKEINVIELKDGDIFDTKKSQGEIENLKISIEDLKSILTFKDFNILFKFASFNAKTKKEIVLGLKGYISENNTLIGTELLEMFNVNFNEIVNLRKNDGEKNIDFYLSSLLSLEDIRELIMNYIVENESYKKEIQDKLNKD